MLVIIHNFSWPTNTISGPLEARELLLLCLLLHHLPVFE